MTHSYHADIHSDGLADNCEACRDASHRPMASLDNEALRDLLDRAIKMLNGHYVESRSGNESTAIAEVVLTLERFGRLAEVNPGAVGAYLRDRWRLDVLLGERAS